MGRKKKHVHVVSISGGRSSGYLAYLMKHKAAREGFKVVYVFCDTGAEHPETYEFIRRTAKNLDIDIICLRLKVVGPLGVGNTYEKVSLKWIKNDLKPWSDMCKKYGLPYVTGPFCTDRMKLVPFRKYCDEHFGEGNYTTYLGIRCDEPKRLKAREGVVYLGDISDCDKQDILDWWKEKSWDLKIPEHLGNCVFCIKKSINKLCKAAQDEPQLAKDMSNMLKHPDNRVSIMEMYRENNSLDSIIMLAGITDSEYLKEYLAKSHSEDSGSCSESCEVFQ